MPELATCSNCLTVFVDVQDRCPTCDADGEGYGAEIELDAEARSAVSSLGGLYGGFLSAGSDGHLLWCTRGVCLVDGSVGLRWSSAPLGAVQDVALDGAFVRLAVGARGVVVRLRLEDGLEEEDED